MDGTESLCNDLDVDPTDVVMLVLAWVYILVLPDNQTLPRSWFSFSVVHSSTFYLILPYVFFTSISNAKVCANLIGKAG